MPSTTSNPLKLLTAVAAFTIFGACADDTPSDPTNGSAYTKSGTTLNAAEAAAASDGRLPELGLCQNLQVPAGSHVSFHVFGKGVQIYRWDGATWRFVEPSADLFADAGGNGLVGKHFGGPTWVTRSGSQVVGTPTENGRCTLNNPDAIPELKLNAAVDGSGVFEQTTLIQRLHTVGGLAPTTAGTVIGEQAFVPYTADYYFYRAPN